MVVLLFLGLRNGVSGMPNAETRGALALPLLVDREHEFSCQVSRRLLTTLTAPLKSCNADTCCLRLRPSP
eukprot:1210698-Alexandrium_andersonii.AAC.1